MPLPSPLARIVGASVLLVACATPELSDLAAEHGELASDQQSSTLMQLTQSELVDLGIGGHVAGLELDCEQADPPSGGSCLPTDQASSCQACVAARCCDEQSACNSIEPMNACAFGSTLLDGRLVDGGEIACLMECFSTRISEGRSVDSQSDLDACSPLCAASECTLGQVGETSQKLALCILGDAEAGDSGCRSECELVP